LKAEVELNEVLPNFIIAGVARCGTTSLYYYLKQHPEIEFPDKKEPKYFSSINLNFPHRGPGDDTVDKSVIRTFSDYKKLFNGLDGFKRVGEASSDYLYYYEYTAKAIRETLGDIPIVILIRDPVERAYSAYNNLVRDNREKLGFTDALKAEDDRINDNWDWMWAYVKGGLYYRQIREFMNYFSKVKVILAEELREHPQEILKEVYRFLNIDDTFTADTKIEYSHSGEFKNAFLKKLLSRNNKISFMIRSVVFKIIPRYTLEKISARLLNKKEMLPETRELLKRSFQEDIEKLEKLTKIDLSKWK
jgi:hypothetical protein